MPTKRKYNSKRNMTKRKLGGGRKTTPQRATVLLRPTFPLRARGRYLIALREAFLNTGFECSTFISESGMSLDYTVEISGQSVVQVVS